MRCTYFFKGFADSRTVWDKAIQKPYEKHTEIRTGPANKVELLRGRWQYGINCTRNRCDFLKHAYLNTNLHFGEFRELSSASSVIEEFRTEAAKFCQSIDQKCDRIAIGISLKRASDTNEEANSFLNDLLSRVSIEPNCRDFLYRQNYPSKIETVLLNRLCTWKVLTEYSFDIDANLGEASNPDVRFTVGLDIDVNTSPDSDPSANLPKFLKNLFDEAEKSIANGDK